MPVPDAPGQNVYVKRFLRSLGVDLKFDWPAEMVKVRLSRPRSRELR